MHKTQAHLASTRQFQSAFEMGQSYDPCKLAFELTGLASLEKMTFNPHKALGFPEFYYLYYEPSPSYERASEEVLGAKNLSNGSPPQLHSLANAPLLQKVNIKVLERETSTANPGKSQTRTPSLLGRTPLNDHTPLSLQDCCLAATVWQCLSFDAFNNCSKVKPTELQNPPYFTPWNCPRLDTASCRRIFFSHHTHGFDQTGDGTTATILASRLSTHWLCLFSY